MTLPDRNVATGWVGKSVVDSDGTSIGRCTALFADDATGLSEWLGVILGDGEKTVYIPAVDASEAGDDVRVAFPRETVVNAPSIAETEHLSEDDEATLYRHYGVSYSTSASESGLPAAEAPVEAVAETPVVVDSTVPASTEPPTPAPVPLVREVVPEPVVPARRQPPKLLLAALGGLATLAALIGGFLGLRRLRQNRQPPPPTPSERRAQQARARAAAASRSLSASTDQLAAWAAPRLQAGGEAASRTARAGTSAAAGAAGAAATAVPVIASSARTAARKAADAARIASETAAVTAKRSAAAADVTAAAARRAREQAAARAASAAAGTSSVLRQGASSAAGIKAAVQSVPDAVSERTDRLQRAGKSIAGKLSAAAALAAGYVLGARAGRQRYEQVKRAASAVGERPEVRRATDRITAAATSRLESASGRPGVRRARDLTTRYYRPNRYPGNTPTTGPNGEVGPTG